MGTAVPVCLVYGMVWFRSGFSCLLNHRKSYVVVFLAEVFALIPVLIGLFFYLISCFDQLETPHYFLYFRFFKCEKSGGGSCNDWGFRILI